MVLNNLIANPLINPVFIPSILRMIFVFIGIFALMLILFKFNLKNLKKSDLWKEYKRWLIILPSYFICVFLGEYTGLAFVFLIIILALNEIRRITNMKIKYFLGLVLLSIYSIIISDKLVNLFYMLPLIYFTTITSIAIKENNKKSFFNLMFNLYISIWIIFSLSHFILLGKFNYDKLDHTGTLLIFVGFSVMLSDLISKIIDYLNTIIIKRTSIKIKKTKNRIINILNKKIASEISDITYVSVLGNIIGAAIGVFVMYFQIRNYLSLLNWLIISILIGSNDMLGNLTGNMFNKFFGIKDKSKIIDIIDSSLRVIIALYYYLIIVIK